MAIDHQSSGQRVEAVSAPRADRRTWLGLAVLTLPVMLVSMDVSVLYLAVPAITSALDPSASEQLWILDIYGFLLAGLLITMGNVGDRIGRRRILLCGALVFGVASTIAAFSPSAGVLIAARALMGLGGATLLPSSLSLIANMFIHARDRGLAIGIWTAVFAGGSAVGPVVGGVLMHHFWWGSVFLINVPVVIVLLLVGPRLVPEFRARASAATGDDARASAATGDDARASAATGDDTGVSGPFDVLGVVLSMAGILPLMYAIKTMASHGFSVGTLLIGLAGLALLVAFLLHQKRTPHPLLDLSLFKNPMFSGSVAVALTGMMALGGMSYLTGVYLQSVLGLDVLAAAIAGLPMACAVAIFSVGAAKVAAAVGTRNAFVGSVVLTAVGMAGILTLGVDDGLGMYMLFTTVAGVGFGIQFSLVSEVVVGSVPPERSGAASSISETCFELGTALGLGLLGSLATLVFRAGGDGTSAGGHEFGDTLGDTLRTADGLGTSGDALVAAAKAAFVDGMHTAALATTALLAVVAVVLAFVMRPAPRS